MDEIRNPIRPPTTEIPAASPRIIPRIEPGVKPSVFSTPISRTRSRTDIAIVLAETSRMVNMMADEMAIRNILTFPISESHPTMNACSLSVLVCAVELRNSLSMAWATLAEC